MPSFGSPLSFRLRRSDFASADIVNMAPGMLDIFKSGGSAHSSHPDFGHLVLLVFEAVLEVVCVSAPGYFLARQGMFDAEAQKFVANLNVQLFTPCLIFTKLASQLTAEKLVELAVIPFIFIVQTLVSYLCSVVISRAFRFKKRPQNFVTAMAVFGNSNSLPISLVISLSKTLKGLHWDKIPGDNDDEVAARGILYLLIFQQLGQLVRWTWGYNVLLAPPDKYSVEDGGIASSRLERGDYDDGSSDERQNLLDGVSVSDDGSDRSVKLHDSSTSDYESGSITPVTQRKYASSATLSDSDGSSETNDRPANRPDVLSTPTNGNMAGHGGIGRGSENHITTFPNPNPEATDLEPVPAGLKGWKLRCKRAVKHSTRAAGNKINAMSRNAFQSLPPTAQKVLAKVYSWIAKFLNGLWEFMNMPLWAMLAAILVASVPSLQHLFFDKGTFINNSVSRAVAQSGGVAVPLILVVLGANLARNTLPKDDMHAFSDPKEERNLLIASLVSRMLFPTILMAPLLALTAKYVPVSILDDPIFVIVCFLLTGAPSALQLAQICQINNVYMGAMSRLLFQSYVIWILPSTLILVMLALEVVEWAA